MNSNNQNDENDQRHKRGDAQNGHCHLRSECLEKWNTQLSGIEFQTIQVDQGESDPYGEKYLKEDLLLGGETQ